MSSPQSAPETAANEEAAHATKDNTTTTETTETEDGATTTSTQPENSGGGSSNGSNGEEGSDNNGQVAATATPVAAAAAAAAVSNNDTQTPPTTASAEPSSSSSTAPSQTKTFVYHPNKITLKFIFANRDGLNVILDCTPADTVGEVKGALLSLWPKDMPECSDGDRVRLICMGKGILMPDSKSLASLAVPVFKTHATPVNVAVRPEITEFSTKSPSKKSAGATSPAARGGNNNSDSPTGAEASTGCSCVIL